MNDRTYIYYILALLLLVSLFVPEGISAMQSSSYKIPTDSINVGGINSTSASYTVEDTIGEQATGPSNSASYALKAGYQQMNEVYLSLTAGSPITLPSINGLTGGTSNGYEEWNVKTDDPAG